MVTLKPRRARVAARCDVLVVGGGPAGMAAALGAAWAGADVLLTERFGFLGGNPTVALVNPLMSWHTQKAPPSEIDPTRLLPQDHGPGEPIVAGALETFVSNLIAADGALAPTQATGFTVPFDPEIYKAVAQETMEQAGVRVLLHAFANDVWTDEDKLCGAVFETKSGPLLIRANVIVDASGDGDLAAKAGARFHIGREEDGRVQPMTLMFRIADFDREAFAAYVREHPDQWRGVHGLWDLIEKARAAGELDLPREDILFFATPHPRELSVNCTRVTGVNGTDVFDLSRAEGEARRQMRQIMRFLKRYVPGFADAYIVQSGTHIGVRETRRIVGEYTLDVEDVLQARKFSDAIARCSYPVDIHNPAGSGTTLRRLPQGEWYEVPLRCLVPKDVDGLLVAGRSISGTHEAHSSYRVTPTAMATGQAAGVCAALASRNRCPPRQVLASAVQIELRRQGAIV
ncbi:FAD-dependent oxidoreductase [uncultured Ferrovibrio sp.]|jgi:PAS domain-containing protein|uniref:FAD-dependent oxidoreductase n=1 Tax=uncultured Ferrovibrio sp. TaxID=1576913 RepID=UPI00262626F2|nr:FAD-dependent oxidoreductase [uncultured Ferrovibrio sp.]